MLVSPINILLYPHPIKQIVGVGYSSKKHARIYNRVRHGLDSQTQIERRTIWGKKLTGNCIFGGRELDVPGSADILSAFSAVRMSAPPGGFLSHLHGHNGFHYVAFSFSDVG